MNFQRALVVEDQPQIVFLLRPLLRSAHFMVDHADSIHSALEKLSARLYEIVVLDRNLPDGDGLELLSSIKELSPDTKTIVLSERGMVLDKVDGLKRGADDYLAKPFATDEFLARVESVMRRAKRLDAKTRTFGNCALLLGEARVKYKTTSVQLSKKEAKLVDLFVRHPMHHLSREAVATQIWSADKYPSASSIDTFMKRLRDKLSATPMRIRTRYNLGYELSVKN